MDITFHPIGVIHSPFQDLANMPIQPNGEASAPGTVDVYPEYSAGLKDLEGFSHIIRLCYLHKVSRMQLTVVPFLDSEPRGVFATCAPVRPNPIGLSIVCGAFTPTEINSAVEAGAELIKLFPARIGGPQYVRDLLAPMPNLRLVPTGGVSAENAGSYLEAGAAAVAIGGNLISPEFVYNQQFSEITARAMSCVQAVAAGKPITMPISGEGRKRSRND